MSYDVAIVLPPIPDVDGEAWGGLDDLIEAKGPAPDVFRRLHDKLVGRFPCLSSLSDAEVDTGVWSDGPLWSNFRERAAVLAIQYPRVDEALPFVIAEARALGCSVFDWASQLVYRPDGIDFLSLTLEGLTPLSAPTRQQIADAPLRLNPNSDTAFLVLENDDSGDFVQVAGGAGVFTLEWRGSADGATAHRVAGIKDGDATSLIRIPTNGAYVTVRANERLTETEVTALLLAFADRTDLSPVFDWRDISVALK